MSTAIVLTPMDLLAKATETGADPAQLEKLMDLQDRWEAKQAKAQFFAALGKFQQECPVIERTAKAHNSKYATLDHIIEVIRPVLRECDLTYRWETQPQAEGWIEVTCVITHALGHSERTSTLLPPDDSGGKNQIQGVGSSNSYGYRYTLCGALGIATADEDQDGGRPSVTVDDLLKYNATVRDEIQSIAAIKQFLAADNLPAAVEAMLELDRDTQIALWRAPTKGGIWTTDERTKIKSDEFSAEMTRQKQAD